ncbi:MAG: molybdopterin-dependent oxidoreductase [Methanobacterium sp.]
MRLKAGIMLLVFIMLFGISGCAKPVDEQNAAVPSPNTVVEDKTKQSLGKEGGQTSTEQKEAENAGNKVDVSMGDKAVLNLDSPKNAAQPAAKGATKQEDSAKISITGTGIKANREFSLKELKQMNDIIVSANYFSRGAEKPGWGKTAHTAFNGVLLYELLADHVGLNTTASQVKIIAEDQYMQVFSIEDLKADYIDETDPKKELHMIIAWSQDGEAYNAAQGAPFRLVMGQQFAGDYNRQKWVNQIAGIVVE